MPFSKKRNVKDDLDLIYLIAPQKKGTMTAKGVDYMLLHKKWRQVIDKKGENLVKKLISQKKENGFYP